MTGPFSPHIPVAATLTAKRDLTSDTALFTLSAGRDAAGFLSTFVPGQFVQLSVPGGGEIPISPAEPPSAGMIRLCVRRVGHVTGLLHRLPAGSPLGIRGPFGRGFPVDEMAGHPVLLLAGGLGIAPLRSLISHLMAYREKFGEITLMYGAREPSVMLFRDELVELAGRGLIRLYLTVDFAPEDQVGGYSCARGLLPDLLEGFRFDAANSYAAVCGPPPLYRCLTADLEQAGVHPSRVLLSLERRMRCGIGRCCHCAIGQKLCCTDGPVFRLSELKDIPEAL
ncbi:FAD/NAD(P)-binding protein [Geomonas sp. Red32]|uniref:FAD/NAD(P)-binding protein n=1 Tax=Geomonas sp. Red32 TaxID=2912856 RepID=UPI00202CF4D1|nr:FAD/NAD(P)-binding protein [Geomonas sp. Red32]MCM0083610.1 FAD/NAD(P)-binding protein [Geomonas sp. Red32]